MKYAFPMTGYVDAADGAGHRIYFESHGPLDAPATIMVHGNAGYVFDTSKLSMMDLKTQRMIIIHARGVGLSQPMGSVDSNLYPHWSEDIEAVRAHLELDKINLFGWSAGAAVCSIYAQLHPARVNDVTFYGAFLGGARELLAYYERSAQKYPDGWKKFCTTYGARYPIHAVHLCNATLLGGGLTQRRAAALSYERIFNPAYDAHGANLDRLVANRMVFANMIEKNFGIGRSILPIPQGATFVRGANDYIATPMTGEILVMGADHDVHGASAQAALRTVGRAVPPMPKNHTAPHYTI